MLEEQKEKLEIIEALFNSINKSKTLLEIDSLFFYKTSTFPKIDKDKIIVKYTFNISYKKKKQHQEVEINRLFERLNLDNLKQYNFKSIINDCSLLMVIDDAQPYTLFEFKEESLLSDFIKICFNKLYLPYFESRLSQDNKKVDFMGILKLF